MQAETRHIYSFGDGRADGRTAMKDLLGSKGANLAEMASLGIPIPAGFTITTEVSRFFTAQKGRFPSGLNEQLDAALGQVEKIMGGRFGDSKAPLLLSVRSGAPVSMPGMMDTVLNIGLNDQTVEGLIRQSGDERFALDSHRRLLQMYSHVVMGLDGDVLEQKLEAYKRANGFELDVELGAKDWRQVIEGFRSAIMAELGRAVPEDPHEQLWEAIRAVFSSWNTRRAVHYRRLHHISNELGTAVNVMAMVFGNMGEHSASGVAFTRNPASGEREPYGEYLVNAQGEDVVAGIRTPSPINRAYELPQDGVLSMEERMPQAYRELVEVFHKLESHYREMQDIEFTVQKQKMWILQTRTGKRTGRAAIKIALDMLDEKLISEREAILRVDPEHHITELLHPAIDPNLTRPEPLGRGLAASPGAAVGEVVLSPDEAARRGDAGERVILVRQATSADDVHGLYAAQGVLTQTGGLTSHAAVVARSIGKPCVSGASEVHIEADGSGFHFGDAFIKAGEVITIDGTQGMVYRGALDLVEAELSGEFERFMALADSHRTMGVRANADTPLDANRARAFGAQGVGLCRTEHMFFATDERLEAMRAVIMAESTEERERALSTLLPLQRADFADIFRCMGSLPVTVRLLDPPLHEFLPAGRAAYEEMARALGKSVRYVKQRAANLRETNPMLGFRGCRVGIIIPEIYDMQVRAIVEAALQVQAEGLSPHVEIMIPLVIDQSELRSLRASTQASIDGLLEAAKATLKVAIGTMIELPRAALLAGEIAREADFFSFGTNDLTQATFGFSRDDAGRFLPDYLERGLLAFDPFVTIDRDGVGELLALGLTRGKAVRPDLVVGICGEHGGDPRSIDFCHELGFDYVSCSAYRVPVARLAAAQCALRKEPGDDRGVGGLE